MDVIGAGRIRVYERAENAWSEQRLDLSDAASIHPMVPKDALQGSLKIGNFPTYSVAASDDWIAIGTAGDSVRGPFRGSVRVLGRSGSDGVWSEQAYRVQAPNTGDNDLFGGAVALSGNVLVVGAPSEDSSGVVDSGAAYVYELTASGFSLVRRLKSASPSRLGWFGVTVAISNDWVAVGAPAEQGLVNAQTGPYGGAVHVYRRTAPNQVESEEDLLVAPGPELAGFGMSIALAGDRLAVGAPGADCPGRATPNNAGAVYLYSNASGKWGHPECLDSGDNHSSLFGWSVALNADALAVGAPWSSGPWRGFEPEVMDKPYPGGGLYEASGSVYVFRSRDGVLQNRACAVKPPNTGACDAFGNWVALADDYLAVGAPFEDGQAGGIGPPDEGNGLMDSGAAYIYALRSGAP
jgi:hypothetical protein